MCTSEEGRLVPRSLRRLNLIPPKGQGNVATLDQERVLRFAREARMYVEAVQHAGLTSNTNWNRRAKRLSRSEHSTTIGRNGTRPCRYQLSAWVASLEEADRAPYGRPPHVEWSRSRGAKSGVPAALRRSFSPLIHVTSPRSQSTLQRPLPQMNGSPRRADRQRREDVSRSEPCSPTGVMVGKMSRSE